MSAFIEVCTQNLDADRPGDTQQRIHAEAKLEAAIEHGAAFTVRCTQEDGGKGPRSTRTYVSNHTRADYRNLKVSTGIAHNGVNITRLTFDDEPLTIVNFHGPHWRTLAGKVQGMRSGRRYWRELAHLIHDIDGEWIACFDANKDGRKVARLFGGRFVGDGIVGVVHSSRLLCVRERRDTYGMRHGYTDHPAIFVSIRRKP